MCRDCWLNDGEPTELAETSPRVIELATAIYASPGGGTGGALHVVLDDFNLDAESIEWCLSHNRGMTPVESECATLLLAMTYDQRAATLARWEGWL